MPKSNTRKPPTEEKATETPGSVHPSIKPEPVSDHLSEDDEVLASLSVILPMESDSSPGSTSRLHTGTTEDNAKSFENTSNRYKEIIARTEDGLPLFELLKMSKKREVKEGIIMILAQSIAVPDSKKSVVTFAGGTAFAFARLPTNLLVMQEAGAVYRFETFSWDPEKRIITVSPSSQISLISFIDNASFLSLPDAPNNQEFDTTDKSSSAETGSSNQLPQDYSNVVPLKNIKTLENGAHVDVKGRIMIVGFFEDFQDAKNNSTTQEARRSIYLQDDDSTLVRMTAWFDNAKSPHLKVGSCIFVSQAKIHIYDSVASLTTDKISKIDIYTGESFWNDAWKMPDDKIWIFSVDGLSSTAKTNVYAKCPNIRCAKKLREEEQTDNSTKYKCESCTATFDTEETKVGLIAVLSGHRIRTNKREKIEKKLFIEECRKIVPTTPIEWPSSHQEHFDQRCDTVRSQFAKELIKILPVRLYVSEQNAADVINVISFV